MKFNDDEQINGIQNGAAGFENEITVGNAKVKIINVPDAQPEETKLKVLVELTGKGKPKERDGLDLVIVLDTSENMNRQDRLEQQKKATEFVIEKLGPIDRVLVVTFSDVANRLCALRQINKESKKDIFELVNGITYADGANISEGLEMALRVLSGRKIVEGRSVGIILMSSGEQDGSRNAAEVEMGNVPVYTFGFGTENSRTMPQVLDAIAKENGGQTSISDVQNTNDLAVAFANCFSGLLTVAVQDLKLILSPESLSRIENVYAGDYHKQSGEDSAVCIMLGNLYDNETRRVLVHVLPPDTKVVGLQVLKVAYKYRNNLGNERKSTPLYASKKQIQNFTQEEIEDLKVEVIHLERAPVSNEARALAYINLPVGEETVAPSSEVPAREEVRNQKKAKSLHDNHTNVLLSEKDNVEEEETSTHFSKVAARVEGKRLTLVSPPCMDTFDKQADSYEKMRTISLARDEDNIPEDTITSSGGTDKDNVKEENIMPSFEAINKVGKLPLISSPYLETPHKQGETLSSTPCADQNDLKEATTEPFLEVATKGDKGELPLLSNPSMHTDKKKETFGRDNINPLLTDVESVMKETTPLPSEVPESGYVEPPPFTLCSGKEDIKGKTITSSSKLKTKGDVTEIPTRFDEDYIDPLLTSFGNVEKEITPAASQVLSNGSVEKPPVQSTSCADKNKNIHRKHGEPFENDKDPLPTITKKKEKETNPASFKLPSSDDMNKLPFNSTQSADMDDDLNEKTTTPSSNVTARGYMEKLVFLFTNFLVFFHLHNRSHQEDESLEENHTTSLPTNEENVKEENTQPSSKVATSGDAHQNQAESSDENHPNSVFTDEENLKVRTIITPSEVAARGYMEEVVLLFSKLLMLFNLRSRIHQKGESFEKDHTSSSSTNEEKPKKENTQLSSGDAHQKLAESSGNNHSSLVPTDGKDLKDGTITTPLKVRESLKKDPTSSLPINEEHVKEENAQPSSKVAINNDEHQKQAESYKNQPNLACTDEDDLKDRTITTPSKVAAKGYTEKRVSLFTNMLMFFNRTHQEGESFEKDYTSSLPTNEVNMNEQNTELSSKITTSGDAYKTQPESSEQNRLNLLPADDDDLKDRTLTTPSKVASKSFTERLVLLFTKLLIFFNLRNHTHQEGESLKKDHMSSLPTSEENVNEQNTRPSSKVVSDDAHHKQAESSDKNGHNSLPTQEDNLKDRTIKTPSNVAARGFLNNLLLFFTPCMFTYQKQEGSFQKDCSGSLSTDERHEKEHQDFIPRATKKFIETISKISNSVATQSTMILTSFREFGPTSFGYSYYPILLIQNALRSPPSEFKTMMKVVMLSLAVATVSCMHCVCFSYAKFSYLAPVNILHVFGFYNPFWFLDIAIIYIQVILVGAYQVYHQPLFEFGEKLSAKIFPNNNFINKEDPIPLPRGFKPLKLNLFRLFWRTVFVIITTVMLMLIPFLNEIVRILGAFGFWPLTVYFPVEMYVVRKKIPEWSSRWISLQILCVACLIISTAAATGSFSAVVTNLKVYRPFQTSY